MAPMATSSPRTHGWHPHLFTLLPIPILHKVAFSTMATPQKLHGLVLRAHIFAHTFGHSRDQCPSMPQLWQYPDVVVKSAAATTTDER